MDVNNGTTLMYIDDDGDNGNVRDGNGKCNGNGDGNSHDAASSAVGDTVDDNDGGNSRTAIGRRQLDNNNGTTTMGGRQCDGNGWPATCRMLASAASPI